MPDFQLLQPMEGLRGRAQGESHCLLITIALLSLSGLLANLLNENEPKDFHSNPGAGFPWNGRLSVIVNFSAVLMGGCTRSTSSVIVRETGELTEANAPGQLTKGQGADRALALQSQRDPTQQELREAGKTSWGRTGGQARLQRL